MCAVRGMVSGGSGAQPCALLDHTGAQPSTDQLGGLDGSTWEALRVPALGKLRLLRVFSDPWSCKSQCYALCTAVTQSALYHHSLSCCSQMPPSSASQETVWSHPLGCRDIISSQVLQSSGWMRCPYLPSQDEDDTEVIWSLPEFTSWYLTARHKQPVSFSSMTHEVLWMLSPLRLSAYAHTPYVTWCMDR